MIRSVILLSVFFQPFSQLIEAICSTTITTTATKQPTTTIPPTVQFSLFQNKYSLNYENETVAAEKFVVFSTNLDAISQHNAAAEAGNVSYTLVANKYSDLV